MYRLRSDSTNNRRRTTALLSAAALFLVVLLATSAQAGLSFGIFQTSPEQVLLEPDGICPTPTPTPTETSTPSEGDLDGIIEVDPDCLEDDPTKPPDGNGGKKPPKKPGDGPGGDGVDKKREGGKGSNKGAEKVLRKGKKDSGAHKKSGKKSGARKKAKGKVDLSGSAFRYNGKYSARGDFDTDKLQFIASRLRARDVSEKKIMEAVYPPFIIGGPAAWTDTWGAARYGPGPIVRTHEGQDVFCKFGDPVLATQPGEIEFDNGGLGGRVARLFQKDGSYWYYAHLSDWNTKEFKSGDKVVTGDVIGYCGNSGNAITTPPHVHFGWYDKSGSARNPMSHLVGWLEEAESLAEGAYERITGEKIDLREELRTSRRFGDSFAPDISELKVSAESLLAAGSSPESGALGLAETALRAALSGEDEDSTGVDVDDVPLEAGGTGEGATPFGDLVNNP